MASYKTTLTANNNFYVEFMNRIFNKIEDIIAFDIGQRNIGSLRCPGDLLAAVEQLILARKVGLITGFYIPAANAGETDGPLGTISLVQGLGRLGKEVTILTDPPNRPLLEAGIEHLDSVSLLEFSLFDMDHVRQYDHLIAIERPGVARDGHYYNMRGESITIHTAPMDLLVDKAKKMGIPTTGIGDGGNEIGMGKVFDRIKNSIRFGEKIASQTKTDFLIVAGVSNWGAWGILAGLSILTKQVLLPEPAFEETILQAMINAGGVDGVLTENRLSVDGFPFNDHLKILNKLKNLVEKEIR